MSRFVSCRCPADDKRRVCVYRMATTSETARIFGTTNSPESLARNAAIQEATPTTAELALCLFDCVKCLPLELCTLIAECRGRVVPLQFCRLEWRRPPHLDLVSVVTVRDGIVCKRRTIHAGRWLRDVSIVYWHWDAMYACVVGPRGYCVYTPHTGSQRGNACTLVLRLLPDFQAYRRDGSGTSAGVTSASADAAASRVSSASK